MVRGKDGGSHPSLSFVVVVWIVMCRRGDPPHLLPHARPPLTSSPPPRSFPWHANKGAPPSPLTPWDQPSVALGALMAPQPGLSARSPPKSPQFARTMPSRRSFSSPTSMWRLRAGGGRMGEAHHIVSVVSPAVDALYCPKCMVALHSVAYIAWYRTCLVLAGMDFFLFRRIF